MPISKATDVDKLKSERRQEPAAARKVKPEEIRKLGMSRDEEDLRDRESLFWRGIWMTVF
ncbi:hypothetical protein [Sinorhizobium psoraleae]|uniref:Uncharacterized protein n=1 Tax=Sinorhizobium psoraleae TaxID=520838 RepID=A0ABT4KRY8_9HYPH|nr:hypothetical protein [Sinorhizobium psoraleae]MCZ4094560.1 hypothetical protein [Sinorhizobium psoraleae]NRP72460.1 hypothetical protein [Sinorhizobium psoraleae]